MLEKGFAAGAVILRPILLLLFVAACSGPDVINALVPEEGYRVLRDRPYGEGPRRGLDIYLPEDPAPGSPTLVFFYGGGWRSGSKADYLFVGEAFASRGYVTVIPDYRLYPAVRYPAFVEDGAAALAWLEENRGALGLGEGPLYLAGHSAGAYIAAMLTLDRRWLAAQDLGVCDSVAATVGLAGPYDFLPLKSDRLKKIFGPKPTRARTQPITYVDGKAPPMLLISGLDDITVSPGNAERLAARIRDAGGVAEEIYYDRIGHSTLVASLGWPLRSLSPALDDVDRFLREHPAADCDPG